MKKNYTKQNYIRKSFFLKNSMEQLFTEIYKEGVWQVSQSESRSGDGSTLAQTEKIRSELEKIIVKYNIKSILDAPCGDFNWMKHVNMYTATYTGGDIVKMVVDENNRIYRNGKRQFIHLDICKDVCQKVDLIICRDCLVHLSFEDGLKALQNFKKSGSKYLLITTFPNHTKNLEDVYVGSQKRGLYGWQPLNLSLPPYNLTSPLEIINEGCTEQGNVGDKSLALYDLSKLL
jgi:hypothetical protein